MNPVDLLKVVTIARGEARLLVDELDIKDGQHGSDGADGDTGPRGASGEAGKRGERGLVGKTGIQGLTGDSGASGADGRAGARGVQGLTGDAGLQGPRGLRGLRGPKGDDGNDGVGVASAKVDQKTRHLIITLTNGVKIDAGIVKPKDGAVIGVGGGRGATGKSAYELAVDNGFEGTEEEWLASLGSGFADTFETVSKNLAANDAVLAYTSGELTSVTYTGGVVKSLGYTSGTLTTITLSGAPAGVTDIVKTLAYNGDGDLIGFSYGPT